VVDAVKGHKISLLIYHGLVSSLKGGTWEKVARDQDKKLSGKCSLEGLGSDGLYSWKHGRRL
jgi:hypothetical protein